MGKVVKNRTWNSHITVWLGFLTVGIFEAWRKDFGFNQEFALRVVSIFLIFNGFIFFGIISFDLIVEKIGWKKYLKEMNWIPFIIDLLLLLLSIIYLYHFKLKLFKMAMILIPAMIGILLLITRIRKFLIK